MTANICMSNENDKYNVEQRTANFCIHSLEAGAKMISLYCLQLGRQEALQVDFSKPSYTSDLQFIVMGPKLSPN